MEYVWVLVPYMTYDIYVMYLCHWHKSRDRGVVEKKHSLTSVRSFLLQERLMVTHHLFILIVLTPVTQVRAGIPARKEPRVAARACSGSCVWQSISAGWEPQGALELPSHLQESPVVTAGFVCSTSGESWETSSWAASSSQS